MQNGSISAWINAELGLIWNLLNLDPDQGKRVNNPYQLKLDPDQGKRVDNPYQLKLDPDQNEMY